MKDFVTVAIFTYAHEFVVLRTLLDKEDIPYFFQNETMISVFPFYSNALGGIHLKVHPKDASRVLQIIDELNTNSNLRIV